MLHNAQDYANLGTHALAPNATHANGVVELDVHNLWLVFLFNFNIPIFY